MQNFLTRELGGGGIQGAGKMKNCAEKDSCPADKMLPATVSLCFTLDIGDSCEVDRLFFHNSLGIRSAYKMLFCSAKKGLVNREITCYVPGGIY